jgi:hypothetical protein
MNGWWKRSKRSIAAVVEAMAVLGSPLSFMIRGSVVVTTGWLA